MGRQSSPIREKVATVARRGNARRTGHGEDDELAAVLIRASLWMHLNVDRQLPDSLAKAIEQARLDALTSRRVLFVVLDANRNLPAGTVREAHAVLRKPIEVGSLAGDDPERLPIELLALFHW